jgi:hypothetical protein
VFVRLGAACGVAAAFLALTPVPPAGAAGPAGRHGEVHGDVLVIRSCQPPTTGNHAPTPGRFFWDDISIRTGPSTECTRLGLGNRKHAVTYLCYVRNGEGLSWTLVKDETLGIQGWVRDRLLRRHGSGRSCTANRV